ncbi:nickel transporter permease [Alkalihalophilus sp. As8PL]|uniref:Nickel transporter permease n=1 Tax=Alkalihalophilus sp. As8PL TaxID=3237103 RepID=A0AB39BWB1_9BACI
MESIYQAKHRLIQYPTLTISLFLTVILLIMLTLGPIIVAHDPFQINMTNRLQSASMSHILGTDQLGRDLFSRILYGGRLTVGLGLIAILLALLIGVPIGLISGYIGGKLDAFFMRIVDGIIVFPDFILAIAIAGILGPSLTNIVIAIVLVKWIVYARVVRGLVMAEKEKEFILAAKISNSSIGKIIRRHLWPQIIPDVVAMAAIDVGKVILIISTLSYIGVGAQPPIPEWGALLNDGRGYFQVHASLMIYPGLAIMATVLCFNLLGDGVKEYMDPRKGGKS